MSTLPPVYNHAARLEAMQMGIMDRLACGDVVILDGACGTELERMRAITSSPLWSAQAVDQSEDLIRSIHQDYIAAGAEIITTSTFRTTKRALGKAGRADEFVNLTKRAVRLAREAIEASNANRTIYVAGSIAPLEDCFSPELVPPDADCEREHLIQAALLADAGVDFLLAETFNSVRECKAVVKGAKATGLPVFLGVTCRSSGDLVSGESIECFVEEVAPLKPDCLLINCTPAQHLHIPLERLAERFLGRVGAYANVGMASHFRWEFSEEVSPSSYVQYASRWVHTGAQVIGGCCGTSPDYIRQLWFHLSDAVPGKRYQLRADEA